MLPFGEALLLWRLERGWTQEELAHQAGISRPNLSAMERGKREVSLRTLRILAAALQIRPGLLADGIGPPLAKTPISFSREVLERLADGVVYGTPLKDPVQKKLAEWFGSMIRSKASAAGIPVKPLVGGKRSREAAWLALTSSVPPAVVRSLLQRIEDRHRRGWTKFR